MHRSLRYAMLDITQVCDLFVWMVCLGVAVALRAEHDRVSTNGPLVRGVERWTSGLNPNLNLNFNRKGEKLASRPATSRTTGQRSWSLFKLGADNGGFGQACTPSVARDQT